MTRKAQHVRTGSFGKRARQERAQIRMELQQPKTTQKKSKTKKDALKKTVKKSK